MCVIIYKPKGIELPEDAIRQCFEDNPHGAGFMYQESGKIIVKKGYFDPDLLIMDINYFTKQDNDVVIHCRIATSGQITPGLCHPFPITPNTSRLTALDTSGRAAIAHNGIVSSTLWGKEMVDYSDTMLFVRDILAATQAGKRKNVISLATELTGSRFALMTSKTVRLFGKFQTYQKCLFSNMYWATPKTKGPAEQKGGDFYRYYDEFDADSDFVSCPNCYNACHVDEVNCPNCGMPVDWRYYDDDTSISFDPLN